MPSPSALPTEVREAAGRRLWQKLLSEPPPDATELDAEHLDGDPERDAAVRGPPGSRPDGSRHPTRQ
jgi:hypothetical protein